MEEHRQILEMVAEGKITVEQGERLLEALRDTAEPEIHRVERVEIPGAEILTAVSRAIAADTAGRVIRRTRRVRSPRPARSVDRIMHFASAGVSADYVRKIQEVLEDVSIDDIVSLSSEDVKPGDVERIREALGHDVTVGEIIALSSEGVTPDYVEGIKEALGHDVAVGEIIALSSEGVSATFIEDLHEAGIETPTVKDVLKAELDE